LLLFLVTRLYLNAMQTQSHKDVVKNITTASQLEGELQLSQAQHGVAVLDIYNAEWGHCKALSETFRRLSTDAGDMVHLRFFSVECNAVLESLHNPDEAKAPPRQKGMEFSPETLVSFWSKMLEQRQNHSKPYFAFYKEGKMRTHLEGIDTPKICRIVHDLCKQQNAAAEYITNQDVLRFWESNFSPLENEVRTSEFTHAMRALLGADAAGLSNDDMAHVTAAVQGGDGGGIVSASSLQSFVGDSGTLRDALVAAIAERRGAAGSPALSASAGAAHHEEKAVVDAAPRAPSPKQESDGHEERHGEAAESTARPADDGGTPHEEAIVHTSSPLTGYEEEAPLNAREADDGAAYRELGDDDEEVPNQRQSNDKETVGDAEDVVPLGEEETAPSTHDNDEVQYPDESPEQDGEKQLEAREVEAISTTAESSAPPRSSPDGANGEHSQETERAPSNAPTSPTPTPSRSSAHRRALGSPDPAANTAADQDESTVNQIFTNRWVTVSEEEMHVWNTVAALPLHYPESTTLMANLTNDEAAARESLPASQEAFPTLAEYLAEQGVPYADVNMMCIAADQKVGSESLSYGKLSLILMSCDSEVGKGLVPECEHFLGELSAGTLLTQHKPLAFTALALSASEAYPEECFYYCLPEGAAAAFQDLSENDVFILNALTPLSTAAPAGGVFVLRIIGLPKVIELATTDESDDTMVLSQWFARLRVVEQGANAITVHFVENVCDEEFQGFLGGYITRLIEDENRLDKKQGEAPADTAEKLGDGEAYEIGDDEGDEEAGEYEEDAEVEADSTNEL
jgi:hypothetical protein